MDRASIPVSKLVHGKQVRRKSWQLNSVSFIQHLVVVCIADRSKEGEPRASRMSWPPAESRLFICLEYLEDTSLQCYSHPVVGEDCAGKPHPGTSHSAEMCLVST